MVSMFFSFCVFSILGVDFWFVIASLSSVFTWLDLTSASVFSGLSGLFVLLSLSVTISCGPANVHVSFGCMLWVQRTITKSKCHSPNPLHTVYLLK